MYASVVLPLRDCPALGVRSSVSSTPDDVHVHPVGVIGVQAGVQNFVHSGDHERSPLLRATRPTLLLGFPLSNALLVPDGPHGKQAVGARYAAEVPPREVGKHGVPLEPQPLAQSRGVEDLEVLGHLYPVKICLLHHDRHHTEIIDEPRGYINKL
jgi:hypothetical protein